MKINSNAMGIETPVKDSVADGGGDAKSGDAKRERHSPSDDLKKMLNGIKRLHTLSHSPELESIENIKLTLKTRNHLRELVSELNEEPSSWIKELEEISTEQSVFSEFVKTYIHFEYCVRKSISFTIFLILNYMKRFSLGVEESFVEVVHLSFDKTVCEKCSSGDHKVTNLKYLKECVAEDCGSDQDDSDLDADYDIKTASPAEEETSSDSENNVTPKKSTVVKSSTRQKQVYCNPFDSDPEDIDIYNFDEPDSQKEEEKVPMVPRTSSIEVKRTKFNCDHCLKVFTNQYNLKLHVVQIHRIAVPGVKVLKCPESNCLFITGSRVCFRRHSETHRTKPKYVKKTCDKIACRYCNVFVSNSSSLKRHILRKHK